jgi:hypothetical protein
MEDELRKRTGVDELLTKEIETTAEGRELVEQINKSMSELLGEMRENDLTNEASNAYQNVRYDLKKSRSSIQQQMLRLAKFSGGKK